MKISKPNLKDMKPHKLTRLILVTLLSIIGIVFGVSIIIGFDDYTLTSVFVSLMMWTIYLLIAFAIVATIVNIVKTSRIKTSALDSKGRDKNGLKSRTISLCIAATLVASLIIGLIVGLASDSDKASRGASIAADMFLTSIAILTIATIACVAISMVGPRTLNNSIEKKQ